MRVPPFERYERLMRSAGGFVLGIIVGAALYNGLFHARFDALVTLNGELESRIEQYEQDLRQFNQFKISHTVIKSIQPYIEEQRGGGAAGPPLDARTEAGLKSRIKEDLSTLIGRSIYDIDSDARLVRTLLDRKVYTGIFDRDYVVEIRTMLVVDNMLKVWVTAEPRQPGGT